MPSNDSLARVLVVDDDEPVREGLAEFLEDEGYAVAVAEDGAQALEWLRAHAQETCVVLLDLLMPVMDGFEFLALKDRDAALTDVPVVVMTAAGPIVEGSLRRKHNVFQCLPKPLNLDRLLKILRACSSPLALRN